MLARFLIAFLAVCVATPALAQAKLPDTPEAWRTATLEDLTAIHDILRDNSPAMLVDRDSAGFRRWLNDGLAQAREGLPKVRDATSYYFEMTGYVNGFRDEHIQWGLAGRGVNLDWVAWPDFVLRWRDGRYEVAYSAPDRADLPPLGASLISCDGKSVEDVVRSHDRYDGDLTLASERYFWAPFLLIDNGDPFVARPASCVFSAGGVTRAYSLHWTRPTGEQIRASLVSFAHTQASLDVQPWDGRGWWITVPSMNGDQDWNGFYAKVQAHLAQLRSSDLVVIDVRGNSGGDSTFGDRLLRLLWGDAMVDARAPDLGPTLWRVTKINRDNWAQRVEQVHQSAQTSADEKRDVDEIMTRYDRALKAGEPTFMLDDRPPSARPPAGANFMHGRVVVLTDYACTSACLDLMDEATALPSVVQAGTETSADTIFMELTQAPTLPSGLSQLSFGHKAWIRRPRGSNIPYSPAASLTWRGRPTDDAGERQWLAQALATGAAGR